jgi:hypothetical protein
MSLESKLSGKAFTDRQLDDPDEQTRTRYELLAQPGQFREVLRASKIRIPE